MPREPPVTSATLPCVPPSRCSVDRGSRAGRLDVPAVAGSVAAQCDRIAADAQRFDAHGDAHAAADAQRGEALLGVAALHLVQQRDRGRARPRRRSDGRWRWRRH